ncbi:hypothetical protein SAMN04488023_107159 [Pedobacter rhizosphaerae]|uniref:Uncharacterized protein n=1 Tax=Pedobacter rhizosphaerae TaxID=390241 RepID=A0A1H9NCE5_9SPHI|nr:hypothetical protein SAMN04488023_107159 [Pedobacter rhizosphaerae]
MRTKNSFQYFLASKIEASKNRGGNDGRWSTDFEDITYLLNNRKTIWKEIIEINSSVADYLHDFFLLLLNNKYLDEYISVHLGYSEQQRTDTIISNIVELVETMKQRKTSR